MNDYEPIDLSEWCNSGTEVLPEDEEPLTGSQTFQGLPVGGDLMI